MLHVVQFVVFVSRCYVDLCVSVTLRLSPVLFGSPCQGGDQEPGSVSVLGVKEKMGYKGRTPPPLHLAACHH